MLDSLIGEKATSLDIDYLYVHTPDDIVGYDFMHLSHIGRYIKKRKKNII